MIVYVLALLALLGSWGYSFYKGYHYARQDDIIKQQVAKIQHIEALNRYLKNGNLASKSEADKALKSLEEVDRKLKGLEKDIQDGKLGKACSDELFKRLR